MRLSQKQIQHLFLRSGFGENPTVINSKINVNRDQLVDEIFEKSRNVVAIEHLPDPIKNNREITDFKVLKMVLKSRKKTREVNLVWLKQMSTSEAQLREKMTFFWHDHFATKVPFAYLMQLQNNTIRKHALGSFRNLLHAISKDPAMLIFLNNQQNKRRKPNENFAREVMELFTLGEGNYTEKDIQEAARAFTGWHVNRLGEFEINQRHHDEGPKTIFGKTGNFNGDDVINMLLENKQTAKFICRKLYRFLINHNEDQAFIDEMTNVFYESDYNIEKLLRFVFESDEFYKLGHIGSRIATPTELLVRYLRTFKLEFKRDRTLLWGQKALGQVLLFPPNVAGWSEQRGWIDSTSLLLRMRLPLVLFGDYYMNLSNGNEPSTEMEMGWGEKAFLRSLKPEAKWAGVVSQLMVDDNKELINKAIDIFIQCPSDGIDRDNLQHFIDDSSKLSKIKSICTHVMALPEFQLI